MRDNAYAKINLSLNVLGKREDGYHELSMIMVPIHFYDILEMDISDKMAIKQNVGYIPTDENNTIIKAINVMRSEFNFSENFDVKVIKHIPTQAGLAGGSADAASAMRLVKKLLKLNISDDKMVELAKKVGADVPFCLKNMPALVGGIGEKLDYFKVNCNFHLLLVKPKKGVSTKLAFSNIDFNTCPHPDTYDMKEALINNNYEEVIKNLGNSLEEPSFKIVKEIENIKNEMVNLGLDGALMSGSGSTVFGISRNLELIKKASEHFKKKGMFVRITSIKK